VPVLTRSACLLATVILAVTGCTGSADGPEPASPAGTRAPSTGDAGATSSAPATSENALPPAAQGIEDCPGPRDHPFSLRRGEDRIHGHTRGRGTQVVVLTHQFRGTPCDLSGLAAALAAHGWRAVSWTTDTSPTPRTLRRLVEHERDRGARTVVLAGASAGGATSVVAAAGIRPRVDAVVALSPSGYAMEPGDVVAAAGRWSGPLLVVAGALEPGFADVAQDVAAAHDGDEELLLVPDAAEHGKDYVRRRTDPVTGRVVAFLAASVRHR
jgi:pimeloyl-ACP methyl ester carboxylesterase